jgi:hypothetical protein
MSGIKDIGLPNSTIDAALKSGLFANRASGAYSVIDDPDKAGIIARYVVLGYKGIFSKQQYCWIKLFVVDKTSNAVYGTLDLSSKIGPFVGKLEKQTKKMELSIPRNKGEWLGLYALKGEGAPAEKLIINGAEFADIAGLAANNNDALPLLFFLKEAVFSGLLKNKALKKKAPGTHLISDGAFSDGLNEDRKPGIDIRYRIYQGVSDKNYHASVYAVEPSESSVVLGAALFSAGLFSMDYYSAAANLEKAIGKMDIALLPVTTPDTGAAKKPRITFEYTSADTALGPSIQTTVIRGLLTNKASSQYSISLSPEPGDILVRYELAATGSDKQLSLFLVDAGTGIIRGTLIFNAGKTLNASKLTAAVKKMKLDIDYTEAE